VSNPHDQTLPIKADGIGFACIAEARTAEKAKFGRARTPFLKPGDKVRIKAVNGGGQSVFGDIEQAVALLSN
jgi:fumarylacetoacetate (FAA) hydrolase